MNRLAAVAAALAVSLFSLPASALGPDGTGYWGAGVGQGSVGDASALAGRVYGGYTLGPWLSVEGAVLGTFFDQEGEGGAERELRAVAASGMGLLTLSNSTWVTPFVKAGVHLSDVTCRGVGEGRTNDDVCADVKSEPVGFVYGVGAAYRIFDADARENHPRRGGHWSLRADWEVYDADTEMSAITASVQYHFF